MQISTPSVHQRNAEGRRFVQNRQYDRNISSKLIWQPIRYLVLYQWSTHLLTKAQSSAEWGLAISIQTNSEHRNNSAGYFRRWFPSDRIFNNSHGRVVHTNVDEISYQKSRQTEAVSGMALQQFIRWIIALSQRGHIDPTLHDVGMLHINGKHTPYGSKDYILPTNLYWSGDNGTTGQINAAGRQT